MSHYDYCCVLFAYRGQFGEQWIRTNFHMTVVINSKGFYSRFLAILYGCVQRFGFLAFRKSPKRGRLVFGVGIVL